MIEVFTDGRAEPNPGLGTYGYLVYQDGRRMHTDHGVVGRSVTNNSAEYFCLIKALEHLWESRDKEIVVFSDSNLLVSQMSGDWKVKKGGYKAQFQQAKDLASGFKDLEFRWIPRERNSEADRLTNLAFEEARDEQGRKG